MLGVSLFIAFWVVLGFGVFFVGLRGGLGGAREALHGQSLAARRVSTAVMLVIYIAFGIAIPALLLTGNHANASSQIGGIKLAVQEKRGRELFGQYCAVCHTLAAANAVGLVGPNLDMIQPTTQLVLHTIEYGCLQNPGSNTRETCLGYGVMPANVVQGSQARAVAAFVGAVAGKE